MKNELTFKEGKIRLLQVSDPQDLKFVRPAMVEMLDKAYDTLKPDAVVFTGDNILGNHLLDARIGNKKVASGTGPTMLSMKTALYHILEPVNKRGIPFAMIYGNHDDMNELTKEQQIAVYRSYDMCMELNADNPDVDVDTYTIELKSESGDTKYCLYMMDCAWQDNDGERRCHEEITEATAEWLKNETEKHKGTPGMLFLHIPLPEQNYLTVECNKGDAGAVLHRDGKYRRLNPTLAAGYFNEPVSCLKETHGAFEIIKNSDIQAVVTGHDHGNSFEGIYDGVNFIQTGAASFRCYGNRHTRGIRIIDIYEDGKYETQFMTYFDLMGISPETIVKNFLNADEFEVIKYTSLGVTAILTTAGVTAAAVKKYKKQKKNK